MLVLERSPVLWRLAVAMVQNLATFFGQKKVVVSGVKNSKAQKTCQQASGGVEKWPSHRSHKPKIAGSTPAPATRSEESPWSAGPYSGDAGR